LKSTNKTGNYIIKNARTARIENKTARIYNIA
jgi:hypothetical protein